MQNLRVLVGRGGVQPPADARPAADSAWCKIPPGPSGRGRVHRHGLPWADITHIDALSHYSYDALMYNSVPAGVVTSREGAQGLVSGGCCWTLPGCAASTGCPRTRR